MKESTRRGSSSLGPYLLEIQRFPLLTPGEETSLVARLRGSEGEEEVHRLVQANLRFVVKIARQYQGRSLPLEDLVGLGNLGLLRAAHRYEPSRGARFLSCAVWWIRKAMLDAPVAGDSSRTLAEVLPDSSTEDPMEALLRREARARVRRALRRLTQREIRVLSGRYGFGGCRARTLGELGRELGVTREAVRQIEGRAREKLSRILRGEEPIPARKSKRRGHAGAAGLRPAPSGLSRPRSWRGTPSACTGSCEG